MKKIIFEKEYNCEDLEDIFENIHYEIENFPTKIKDGLMIGTISIQLTYSDYAENKE